MKTYPRKDVRYNNIGRVDSPELLALIRNLETLAEKDRALDFDTMIVDQDVSYIK